MQQRCLYAAVCAAVSVCWLPLSRAFVAPAFRRSAAASPRSTTLWSSLDSQLYVRVPDIDKVAAESSVYVRGRLHAFRSKGNSCFLVLRQSGGSTVQACLFKDTEDPERSKELLKFLKSIPEESIIDIQGTVKPARVSSCTQKNVEIHILSAHLVSSCTQQLPFSVRDAARSPAEVMESQETERPIPVIGQDLRLDHRWLDLRTPANQAIMRVKAHMASAFRQQLIQAGFVEIFSPKLVPGQSEGGAEVFRTDYFGQQVCLAQSPQLYKQMAISSDLDRVFEIGPVFRAEKSRSRRHLCEFTGLDLEMSILHTYQEALLLVYNVLQRMFEDAEASLGDLLATVREQYPSEPLLLTDEPVILTYKDALQLLRSAGESMSDFDDLSDEQEQKLGRIVHDEYGTDLFAVDQYPRSLRPFYTMPSDTDADYSNSYDLFLRGQEIASGAQRINNPAQLKQAMDSGGLPTDSPSIQAYIKSFEHGCPPHAGAGLGLDRIATLFLGLDNVRKASMFPRTPTRASP